MTTDQIKSKLGSACSDLVTAEQNGDEITPAMRQRVVDAAGQLYDAMVPHAPTFVDRLLKRPEDWEETVRKTFDIGSKK